jgi:GDSL-like lipase/acylhydrolase family protein
MSPKAGMESSADQRIDGPLALRGIESSRRLATMAGGGGFRGAIANLLLVLASTVVMSAVIFAAGELYLRWSFGWNAAGQWPTWTTFDERRGWTLKPGEYSYVDLVVFRKVHLSINELGLRNKQVALTVPDGIQRISVVGDSFVFGAPLNDGETLTGRLQRLLGPTHQVVNMGVPGYGTGQELVMMEELIGKRYEAGSKIVIVFFSNDIQDDAGVDYSTNERDPIRPAFSVSASGSLVIEPATRPQQASPPRPGLLQRSLFYNFVRSSAMYAAIGHPSLLDAAQRVGLKVVLPRTPGIIAGWYSDGWPDRWARTDAVLGYAVDRLRALSSSEIILVYMPSPFQIEQVFRRMLESNAKDDERYRALLSDIDRPQRMLRQFGDAHRVRVIDLSTVLRDSGDGGLYFPRDGHLTELGSELVARELATVLNKKR